MPVLSDTSVVTSAIVRDVPATYDLCTRSDRGESIDVALARGQHESYCRALGAAGVNLVRIAADDRFPDCCFVEDPALVIDDRVIILNMGEPSRRGEGEAIREALSQQKTLVEMAPSGTLEGGDVLRIDDKVFVGLTARSNRAGFETLRSLFDNETYDVIPVELSDALHLKSVCAYLGRGHVMLVPGHFDERVFGDYARVEVAAADAYSANCIALNGKVIMAEGFEKTRLKIEAAGFETMEIAASEFRKGDGGLSCLSIRF